jgi:hypothetical protein
MRTLVFGILLLVSFLTAFVAKADEPLFAPPVYVSVLPNSRSLQVHETGSVFVAAINPNAFELTNCFPSMTGNEPAGSFPFQLTDPLTNQPIGAQQQKVNIPAGGTQTWIQFMTPAQTTPPVEIGVFIVCDGFDEAGGGSTLGVDTFNLSADIEQPPDIISLALTGSRDGVARLPAAYGAQAFAVATINLGSAARITANLDSGLIDLPVNLTLCRTDISGACMAPPTAAISLQIASGATPTFAVFVQGQDILPFLPQILRVYVNFTDETGALRGRTSVAVADPTPMPPTPSLGGIYTGGTSGPRSDPASLNGPVLVAVAKTGQAFGLTQSGAVFNATLSSKPPNFGGVGNSSNSPNAQTETIPTSFIFDGVLVPKHWIGGYYFVGFTEGRIDLAYQSALYERRSSLATIQGTWNLHETSDDLLPENSSSLS